eukprot:2384498-Alexandrium_andersonii.AAC.1
MEHVVDLRMLRSEALRGKGLGPLGPARAVTMLAGSTAPAATRTRGRDRCGGPELRTRRRSTTGGTRQGRMCVCRGSSARKSRLPQQ